MLEKEDVKQRWVEYIEELFNDLRHSRPGDHLELEGDSVLKSEVTATRRSMKNSKALGNKNITKDLLDGCSDIGISRIAKNINKIYECIPQHMKEPLFMPIPKKGDILNFSNYHLVSLMSHVTKVLIRIIMSRLKTVTLRSAGNSLAFGKIRVQEMQSSS